MKGWPLAVVLLLASLSPALTGAAAGEPFALDAEGDVQAVAGFTGQGAPLTTPESDPADLVSLDVVEADDGFTFVLTVKSLASNAGPATYQVAFEFRDVLYFMRLAPETLDTSRMRGDLYASFEGDEDEDEGERYFRFEHVARLDVAMDTSAGTLTTVLPKEYLQDLEGKSPVRGDLLEDFVVTSSQTVLFSGFLFRFSDRMPDSGDAGSFNLTKGGSSNGHLVLASEDPFRVSNGGSSSFLIQAILRNDAPLEDEAELTVEQLPEGWDVTVPNRQKVPAQGEVVVNVLVSLPFAHDHGGVSEFTLKATSSMRRDVETTLRMGVLHTPIPQPAGHHDELFFHTNSTSTSSGGLVSVGGNRPLAMNTDADHMDDVAEVAPNTCGFCITDEYRWRAIMNPGLALGLDFDLEREGLMTAVIKSPVPGTAVVSAELLLDSETDGNTLLAQGESSAQEMSSGQAMTFSFPVEATDDSDYVPYRKGQNLVLILSLQFIAVQPGDETLTPKLMIQESSLKLPLNEYRDVVTDVAAQGARLELEAAGPLEKRAQPGATMTYAFNVTNNGAEADTFVAEVAGADADTGAVVPVDSFVLEPGESRSVTLGVSVPREAQTGQEFEVLLLVRSQTDPSNMAIARTYTSVAFGAEAQPDETEQLLAAQGAEQETPGFPVVLGLAALAAVALLRRRA